ncbi:MAG: 2-succinyl-6-hydroxy-2,4-cyclohexadiene-1-carboxylate synthase [Armatimonadota bacterium]|nr:2-succinyl-6-hydroxy-2,4-cyclohexadiene-1-carboxylate synthase [Armatimonadota bacterium]MDR5696886.1 2-succinyl-6-hydroxy-2,4-cyclohexadiene-1-carboxylate synthase [Armatimonadota bacterium]
MPRIGVRGVQLNVETAGSGAPLVLLHGFAGTAQTWVPHTAALAKRCRVIAPDLLGHGDSDAPDDFGRYAIEEVSADLVALLDRLRIDRAVVVGYSMGGRIALNVAIGFPDRVSALVLESASPGIADAAHRRRRAAQDAALAEHIERDGVEAFVDFWERQPIFASQARLPPGVRTALRRQRLRNGAHGLANCLRGLGQGVQPPLWHRMAEVTAPTLLLAGALDADYVAIAERMHDAIRGSQLAIVPDAGHAVHLERPEAFGAVVDRWLRSLCPSPGSHC